MIHFIFQQLAKISCGTINLFSLDILLLTQVTCLGIVIDSELTFDKYVRQLSSHCCQLTKRTIIFYIFRFWQKRCDI